MTNNNETKVLKLKKEMVKGTAIATTFEEAIKENGLTEEIICLIYAYYKDDYDFETVIERFDASVNQATYTERATLFYTGGCDDDRS